MCRERVQDVECNRAIARLEHSIEAQRIPITAYIEVTHRCNFRCLYCFQAPIREANGYFDGELTRAEWASIMTELRARGCLFVRFTGGELGIRRDFVDIYNDACDRGFTVSMITNASLLHENDLLGALRRRKPSVVVVSLYGASELTYAAFTGQRAAWARVETNLRGLADAGIKLHLQTVANIHTYSEIASMQSLAERLHARFHAFSLIHGMCDGNCSPRQLQVSPEQRAELIVQLRKRDEFDKYIADESRIWGSNRKQCCAGAGRCCIDPVGRMFLCPPCTECKVSILENGCSAAWEAMGRARKRYVERPSPCDACEQRMVCGICAPVYCRDYGSMGALRERCSEGQGFVQYLSRS